MGWGSGNPPGGPVDGEMRGPPDRSWVNFDSGLSHDALLEGTRMRERGRELARARQFLLDNGHPDTGPTWDDWVDQIVEDLLAAIHGEG